MTVEIKKFCGCMSLTNGVILIGVIESIKAFVALILCSAYAEHPQELLALADSPHVPSLKPLRALLIIWAILSALLCLASIVIIFAAETNRPVMLIPWLIIQAAFIGLFVISTMIILSKYGGSFPVGFIIANLLIVTLFSLFGVYKMTSVYSLYRQLKRLNF